MMILEDKRLYRVFGSGANHTPYAYFIGHSKQHNNGRAVGLLRPSDCRMASFFYCMHRGLRCKPPLETTVHAPAWVQQKRWKKFISRSAEDIKMALFWRRRFVLLRSIFPLLKLLRMADSNQHHMDKVVYYLFQALIHIGKSREDLSDPKLFPSDITIPKEMEADANFQEDEDDVPDEESTEEEEVAELEEEEDNDVYVVSDEWGDLVSNHPTGIYNQVLQAISKRTPKILHDFAYTAYACSIKAEIVQDAKLRLDGNGEVRNMIEGCVRRLFSHEVELTLEGLIDGKIDMFWDELKHFQNR